LASKLRRGFPLSRNGVWRGPEAAEGDDLVRDVVADVGAAEIGDAGELAPMLCDGFLALAEIRLVRRDGAAAAEFSVAVPWAAWYCAYELTMERPRANADTTG